MDDYFYDDYIENNALDKDSILVVNKPSENDLIEIDKMIKNKNINNDFNSDPMKIEISKDLIYDSYTNERLDNTFIVFKSVDDIFYLIYTNLDNSIIAYNLIDNKKTIEIKNSNYWSYITNLRHYFDSINKRDLLISISYDNNLKLWNINNWECLIKISYINRVGYLYSACFLNENNHIYIVTSNYCLDNNSEKIKVFDLQGNKIKEINNSYNDNTYFIDSYYDYKSSNNFIITANKDYVASYDYNNNTLYNNYKEKDNKDHNSIIINDRNEIIELIESSEDGYIRIWDFHLGILLKKYKVGSSLYGLCLWNNDFLFIGAKDKTIKLLDLQKGKVVKCLSDENSSVIALKKIIHPEFGECLISQGYGYNKVILWINYE